MKPVNILKNMNIILILIGKNYFKKMKKVERKIIQFNQKNFNIFNIKKIDLGNRIYFNVGIFIHLYRAANLNHGHWTTPYFDCNGKVKKWVITYASPFFGLDSLKEKLEFK